MERTAEDFDVVIVGYGPVGAATAALLGVHGVRTLVVDRSLAILESPRAIALDNEALRILQMVGLAEDAFAKVAIPYVRMRSSRIGEFGRLDTSGTIDGHPKLVTFFQPDLERALRANAEARPTVVARTGVAMTRLEDDGTHVTAVLRAADGAESTVRARYLIGADGAGSQVRAAIGEAFRGETYPEDWLIIDALDVPGDFDHVEFLCDPDRPTPHMVAPGGRTRWEFMLKPGETRAQMEQDATIARLLKPWARAEDLRIERKAVYRFEARACRRFRRGRVFLVGDAAHVTPPFVGQGLVSGLRDAANLAWKLAWVVKRRASPSILDSYDQERRPHAVKMIAFAKRMGALVMPRSAWKARVVHGTMAFLQRIPRIRRIIDEGATKPKSSFPEGFFVRGGRGSARGTCLSQIRSRDSSGKITWSDDALGSELALVGFGIDPGDHLSETSRARWSRAGGRTLQADAQLWPGKGAHGWCVVVRPDRTILHDGPMHDAERIVRESLSLLGRPDAITG